MLPTSAGCPSFVSYGKIIHGCSFISEIEKLAAALFFEEATANLNQALRILRKPEFIQLHIHIHNRTYIHMMLVSANLYTLRSIVLRYMVHLSLCVCVNELEITRIP